MTDDKIQIPETPSPEPGSPAQPARPRRFLAGFRRLAILSLLALLWIGFSYDIPKVCAVCTPYWSSYGITFVNGEQTQDATNTNYNYWNYCQVYIPTTGVYTPVNNLTWTLTSQSSYFKENWNCTYNGKWDFYFTINCTWSSNITAFWAQAPACTLTASPGTPVNPGDPVTLTASCGASPTSYVWTGAPFATSASSGTVNPTTTTTYTVQGSNASGTGTAASVTVTVNQPTTPTCTLTATPSTINLGDSSTLAASCSPSATSYAWTNAGFATSASGGAVSPQSTTTYSVTGSNASGPGSASPATVTVNPLVNATSVTQVNASPVALNRATMRYNGTISVMNTGSTTITGPIYVFFTLPAGITLPSLPAYGGLPYLEFNIQGGLAPGATTASTAISFADPSNARIGYTTTRSAISF